MPSWERTVCCVQSVSFQDLGDPPSGGIFELNATDPLVAPPAGLTAFTPDQIHMTLAGGGTSPPWPPIMHV